MRVIPLTLAKGTPVLSRLRLLGALAAAVSVVGAVPAAAHAGTYSVVVDTSDDISGWQFFHDPGFYGCSIKSHPGPCADGDVPSPTPLRIFGSGAADHLANAYWEWLAPPTTTIDHAARSRCRPATWPPTPTRT